MTLHVEPMRRAVGLASDLRSARLLVRPDAERQQQEGAEGEEQEVDRDDFIADATDAARRAYGSGGEEEKSREAVRLAVRRCATVWTGKKPLVEVMLLKVA